MFLSDLVKHIKLAAEIDFMMISTYEGTQQQRYEHRSLWQAYTHRRRFGGYWDDPGMA